jgi:hypothetical protein
MLVAISRPPLQPAAPRFSAVTDVHAFLAALFAVTLAAELRKLEQRAIADPGFCKLHVGLFGGVHIALRRRLSKGRSTTTHYWGARPSARYQPRI